MNRRPTTQDISWFLDLDDNGQLDLNPPYQRRSVWTRKDRIFYLDTIFNGYPCPAIFLHKTTSDTGKGTYHVVDGKQRLETILLFAKNRLTMPQDHSDLNLRGMKFRSLGTEYKQKLWDYVLAVDMLDIVEQAVVDEVFDRLNRNSRKLERQELRHAKFDGWLINFVEKQSELQKWKDLGVATTSRAKRMKEVQFLSELLIYSLTNEPQGFSQDSIDEYYANYDSPEDEVPDFDIEIFEDSFTTARDFLISMEEKNGCITKYAKTYMHFYSIWNFVSRHRDSIKPDNLAPKYSEFMEQCMIFGKEQVAAWDGNGKNLHLKYAANSIGANTELPQRRARLEALESALLA